jgi:hypothetical protein
MKCESRVRRQAAGGGLQAGTWRGPRARPRGGAGITGGSLGSRPEAALELPDQALELGHPLAEGSVLGVEPGDHGRGLGRARLPPAGDAAARGANPLRASTRQGTAADPAQTGVSSGVGTPPGATSGMGPVRFGEKDSPQSVLDLGTCDLLERDPKADWRWWTSRLPRGSTPTRSRPRSSSRSTATRPP